MRTLILILICVLVWGFKINPSESWKERKGQKMINVSLNQLPVEIDPTKLRMMEHFLLLQLYSQTLVRVDESGELVSYLAKRWEYDTKKKEYIFSLDPNAKFSDGSIVTSRDVAWSLSRHFWIGSPSIVANYLKVALANTDPIQANHIHPAFKVINNHTLSIQLKSFYHPLLHVLSMPGFSITKYQEKDFKAIGSGPLKLEHDENIKKLIFLRNKFFQGSIELNQVTVFEAPIFETTKKMFADGVIDLALGLNLSDLSLKASSSLGLAITPSESLATIHAYINTKGVLRDDEYRQAMSSILSATADDFSKSNSLVERLNNFLPVGIMPKYYYKHPVQNKQGTAPKESIKIVLNQNIFPVEFVDMLKMRARERNVSIVVVLCTGAELIETFKNKNYDIVGSRYVGNFPDPDAYIDFINSDSPIHAGEFDSKSLFASLEKSRFESDQELRLSEYVKSFHEFEQKNYFIPLFRSKIPIVHRKELSFPNTKFRYEGELWRIFWKN